MLDWWKILVSEIKLKLFKKFILDEIPTDPKLSIPLNKYLGLILNVHQSVNFNVLVKSEKIYPCLVLSFLPKDILEDNQKGSSFWGLNNKSLPPIL